jgi:peptidyl-prolyl cis-trans isomerase B (cyclophilin B)
MVKLETSMGDIFLELDEEKAPKSAENFLAYVNDGHYDGTIFHQCLQ